MSSPAFPFSDNPAAPPSRPAQLRQTNARGLLRLLQTHNPCSKADLVRHSGLSAPTVSSGIAHLDALGLIEHLGDGESSGGRPPGLLRFNTRHGSVAAVDIGGTRVRLMLADLGGNPLAHTSFLLAPGQKTPEAIAALIANAVRSMCRDTATPLRKLLHLTAGAPGITNAASGIVLAAPNLDQWVEVPLRQLLERATALPCLVDNDTNLAALGESWRGAARNVDSFVFIALGTGVGAGIFLNGRLHRGAHWSAGEIGYLGVPGKKRAAMNVRELGQLEQVIGGPGIEAEWRRRLEKRNPDTGLLDLRASQIFDRAAAGDRQATDLLGWVAAILAEAIADIAVLLNPEVVVLGGGVGAHPELCRVTAALLQRHVFAQPSLRSSALGTDAQLHGAISVSLAAVEARLLEQPPLTSV